jgi:hypothetical protein
MRIGLTIVLNGLHHMMHNNYAEFILNNFDYWVVVEGASKSVGSTYWCNKMPDEYHNNGNSVDGTVEYLLSLKEKYKNLICVTANRMWNGKDEMVNVGISEIKKITNECFLWAMDIDSQWTLDQIELSEKELVQNNGKTGAFKYNHYVGKNLISIGYWGGGNYFGLFDWKGEEIEKHEPTTLKGGNEKIVQMSEKFQHYGFYFEKDVLFKDKWYSGHSGIYENWLKLQKETVFPQPTSYLFPQYLSSTIIKID